MGTVWTGTSSLILGGNGVQVIQEICWDFPRDPRDPRDLLGFPKGLECFVLGGAESREHRRLQDNNNNTLSISCSDQTNNTPGIPLVKVQLLTLPASPRTQGEFRISASLLIRHKISCYHWGAAAKVGKGTILKLCCKK